MARIRHVESAKELEQTVDDFRTRGFKIKQRSQYSAKVKDKDWGDVPAHGFIFLLTLLAAAVLFNIASASASAAWLVALLANVLYASHSWLTADEVIIKVENVDRNEPTT